MSTVTIHYEAKCRHCDNYQSNGRGKKSTCKIDGPIIFGPKTKACKNFKL